MSNLVLYRKHRPQTFSEVIGQNHVIQTLANAIKAGKTSHAYLFAGTRGVGKTTVARLLAKALNCEKRKGFEPCNSCDNCKEISQGSALDLIEIDAASNRGIDEIRALREGIKFVPTKSKYKVFIIDECHMLTKEAFNALLKTLEEPPAHAIFVLATTEAHKVIPTILSRVQRFDFKKLSLKDLLKRLEFIIKKEGLVVDKEALTLIALNADGCPRDAESMLEQVITFSQGGKISKKDVQEILGLVDINLVIKFTDYLAKKDTSGALSFLNKLVSEGHDLSQFSQSFINYLRKMLFVRVDKDLSSLIGEGLTKEQLEIIMTQSEKFSLKNLSDMTQSFLEAAREIRSSFLPQIPIELAVVGTIREMSNELMSNE